MIATLLPLALLAAHPPQPQPNPPTATISGHVFRADGRAGAGSRPDGRRPAGAHDGDG